MQLSLLIGAALLGVAAAECTTAAAICSPTYGQATCDALSAYGCVYTNNECAPTTTCESIADKTTCDTKAANGCAWSAPGVCDATDMISCGSATSPYYTCLTTDFQALATSTWLLNDPTAIQESVALGICNCLPKYFNCITAGECAAMPGILDSCSSTVSLIGTVYGVSCDTSWCDFGVTASASTFDVTFSFAAPSSTWTQQMWDDFVLSVDAWLPIDPSWTSFDKAAGTMTITIPEGTSISSTQLLQIQPALENVQSQPASAAFEVQGATVTAEVSQMRDLDAAPRAGVGAAAALLVSVALFF